MPIIWNKNLRAPIWNWLLCSLGLVWGIVTIFVGIKYYDSCGNKSGGFLMVTGGFLTSGSLHTLARSLSTADPLITNTGEQTFYHLHLLDTIMSVVIVAFGGFGMFSWIDKNGTSDCNSSLWFVGISTVLCVVLGLMMLAWFLVSNRESTKRQSRSSKADVASMIGNKKRTKSTDKAKHSDESTSLLISKNRREDTDSDTP